MLNKKDVEKVKNRIAYLEQKKASNLTQIRTLQILNKSLDGGIIELSSILIDLNPEKKEKKT